MFILFFLTVPILLNIMSRFSHFTSHHIHFPWSLFLLLCSLVAHLGGRLGRGDNEGADIVARRLVVLHVRAVAQGESPALPVVCGGKRKGSRM
jgi:hypothetical protein